MSSTAMLRCNDLKKLYEEHLAVDGVSFSLESGNIGGLVGPNGAGKTTTMRCLAGLLPATAGRMNVAGCDLSDHSGATAALIELKRRLAYVPDDPPLFDDLTVGQHLEFIGRVYQVEDHRSKATQLLEYFQLGDKVNSGATTLSRGMRQKLAICCAYLYDPVVLLLDEPMTGLDPPGIRRLLRSIQERAAAGATIIISSHLLAMIEDVCTHLIVMQRGKLQYFGEVDALRQEFASAKSLEQAYFEATASELATC
ncbi:MAG: ABC transporter ATP-binding protein [Planctomycetota bacterium]